MIFSYTHALVVRHGMDNTDGEAYCIKHYIWGRAPFWRSSKGVLACGYHSPNPTHLSFLILIRRPGKLMAFGDTRSRDESTRTFELLNDPRQNHIFTKHYIAVVKFSTIDKSSFWKDQAQQKHPCNEIQFLIEYRRLILNLGFSRLTPSL